MLMEYPQPEQERGPIGPAALAWIKANPEAMELIRYYAMQASARSKRVGIRLILERVRWDEMIRTRGSKWKINNNYAPYIARWLISQNPSLEEAVELRRLRSI